MSRSFHSPTGGSPCGSSRLQQFGGGVSQRLRSSSLKKPPEPLRRAVADCLSSSSTFSSPSSSLSSSSSSFLPNNPSTVASEAAKTLRDYLGASSTTDLAYSVIIDHALAEKERRYVPSEQTLLQIDQFCASSISECDSGPNQRATPWSKSSSQHSGASVTAANTFSPLPASRFPSEALLKSLNYVRALVARHIPKRSFQPENFVGSTTSSKPSLPTLSSLFSRSSNSPLSPTSVTSRESPERKDTSNLSVSKSLNVENIERKEVYEYISTDVLTWRWPGEPQLSSTSTAIDCVTRPHDVKHGFLEVGAAALLVGDMEAKRKGQPWQHSSNRELHDLHQLLQPSTVTTATNIASAHSHLRVITASKRTKPGPNQVWEDLPVSTFHPRSRPLFQYRPYSEQQPLRLNPAEVQEVIAAVCLETSLPKSNIITVSSRLSNNSGRPSMDAAVSVLIKLVIDIDKKMKTQLPFCRYVLDSQTATPLTLSMLEEMISSPRLASKVRAFDLIINLGVHAHLLEPMLPDDSPIIEEECPQELYHSNEVQLLPQVKKSVASFEQQGVASAMNTFESWLLSILFEILLLLVQIEEKEETVWASALSCLLYFVCDRGKICRQRLEGLDIRVIKVLLEISRENSWAELVRSKLICMLANMFYQVSEQSVKGIPNSMNFLFEQVDLLGGIEFVCLEYSQANSMEEKRNLFVILLDYVLHQVNETCVAAGDSEFRFDEIQHIATVLILSDAPQAFYISLLDLITKKLDSIISFFSHLDEDFSQMIWMTKSYKSLETIEEGILEYSIEMKAKVSWATLHSLLHSERISYRQNGYIWLVELLLTEINEERDKSIWSSFKSLQRQIGLAGSQDYSTDSEVSLPIWILCGLLKSKHNFIRWGFLFVIEKLLIRCKLLLDEDDLQSSSSEVVGHDPGNCRLEKANAVIDIMSSALSLVAQINETDRINILKMCDMLFSQLCLRHILATEMSLGDLAYLDKSFGYMEESGKGDRSQRITQHHTVEFPDEVDSISSSDHNRLFICKTASLAALLLQGQAIVPMQLVARVPTSLLYWPLIQLAGAAADDIALGVAVGSKGRGNLPGATSDIRAALLLLLIGKCTTDSAAFQEVGGEEFFRELLDDTDSRVAYYCSAFLLKRMMTEEPEKYQRMLQSLIFKAQQINNEKLLENPYLQIRGILQLSNDLGSGL
ncbi:hypothetical protein IFM89_011956 [Coptis chinensis]|uniref:Uncharacterized protein n=1 Tax=Coptis chinensis TaxID=261450 RepID=A0A835LE27_9MAGN|nr:hypothetical protein IFM89_011956 [Coptis chinensis]